MLARAMGVKEIDYVDNSKERLLIADKLGANKIIESYSDINEKYDLVIDTSSTNNGLKAAFKSVRNFGTISSSGIYIKKAELSLIDMYAKGVTFKIGLANARTDAENVLKLLERVNVPFELSTTKLDNWENAEEAFLTESTKVIVKRDKILI